MSEAAAALVCGQSLLRKVNLTPLPSESWYPGIDLDAVTTVQFGSVECGIGPFEGLRDRRVPGQNQCNADAQRRMNFAFADLRRG